MQNVADPCMANQDGLAWIHGVRGRDYVDRGHRSTGHGGTMECVHEWERERCIVDMEERERSINLEPRNLFRGQVDRERVEVSVLSIMGPVSE